MSQPKRRAMVSRAQASRLKTLYGHLVPVKLSADEIGECLRRAGAIEWVSYRPSGLPDKYREIAPFAGLSDAEKLALAKGALYQYAR